eukprot:gb/GEZN01006373.1/.p1 GENE.gb/GEZN01006373.1/~~gb/GEZN01006373.1/.p1  ORF type:complete len:481 (+),score=91.34 gb/GEZN01006373.1/:41-1483(+)
MKSKKQKNEENPAKGPIKKKRKKLHKREENEESLIPVVAAKHRGEGKKVKEVKKAKKTKKVKEDNTDIDPPVSIPIIDVKSKRTESRKPKATKKPEEESLWAALNSASEALDSVPEPPSIQKQKIKKKKKKVVSAPVVVPALSQDDSGTYKPGDLLLFLNPESALPEDVLAAREKALTGQADIDDKPESADENQGKESKSMAEGHEEEDDEAREKRTIFVGNVPLDIKKKDLVAFFVEFGEIESVRLRSISFSNPKLPRKAALAKKAFHEARDTCNAYVVFKDEASVGPALSKNGSELQGKVVRVDFSTPHASDYTIFVGNLPFNIKEDELRNFFEDCGTITNVRCVRDSKFNIGKGIAFVSFEDAEGVRNGLTRNEAKFQTRELRVFKAVKPGSIKRFKNTKGAQRRFGGQGKNKNSKFGRKPGGGKRPRSSVSDEGDSFQGTKAKKTKILRTERGSKNPFKKKSKKTQKERKPKIRKQ